MQKLNRREKKAIATYTNKLYQLMIFFYIAFESSPLIVKRTVSKTFTIQFDFLSLLKETRAVLQLAKKLVITHIPNHDLY